MTVRVSDSYESGSFDVVTGSVGPGNPWVETAWTVIEAADDLGDEITMEACQRVIDDDCHGRLPAQSDVSTIFVFLNAHAH